MKFTNGQWLLREGVKLSGAVDLRDYRYENGVLTVFAAQYEIRHRGQTLDGPLLTIEFSAPASGVLRVNASHFKGGKMPLRFAVRETRGFLANFSDEGDVLVVKSGELTAKIRKRPFSVEYWYEDRLLTVSDTKQLAYIKTDTGAYMKESLKLSVGENIYGLGERFSPFVKNGQSVTIWNEDGGTSSEQSYKNIPLYLSSRGYGVFVNDTGKVEFEVGSEIMSKVQFSVPGENLEYFIIGGESLKNVVENYTHLLGKPALPPQWSFGLWLSTSFTTDYDEKTVTEFVDGMFSRKIPLSVFHFDCFWMREYEWCNFEWDKNQFPDVKGMLKRLREKGLKICVWINPYIAQKSRLFREGTEKGFLLKKANGDVYQVDTWQAGMGFVDFTNPDACSWYTSYLAELMDMGVDCFKTDFGERIPANAVYFNGERGEYMHNYYTHLYNQTVFSLIKEKRGEKEAIVFARSATAGGQQFPVHWGGDCYGNYESMAESLRGGLSLVMCGFGFWSHDIGGFESFATADVYKRWVAFGLMSTHSRLHGSTSYRVPWVYDEEAVDVLRFFTNLKHRLMPYIYAQAVKTNKTGIPVMRPMVLEFEDNINCLYLDKQYCFGDDIIAAPVFDKDGFVDFYLPQGKYVSLISDETVDGGKSFRQQYNYFGMPLYARENSIIVMGKSGSQAVYNYADNVEVHLYNVTNSSAEIYQNGELVATIAAKRENGEYLIKVDGKLTNATFIAHDELGTREVKQL